MERQICTFEEWISSYFDYPATKRLNDFGNGGIRQGRTDPAIETEYVVRAFENPRAVLWQFSNEQLGGGLWKMLNGANGNNWTYPFHFEHDSIPDSLRERAIQSIYTLFEQLFAPRCSNRAVHLNEPGTGLLDTACYMWWDTFPTFSQVATPLRERLNESLLNIMRMILELNSVACQESAIHGLAEWNIVYPDQITQLLDVYLERPDIRPELRQYAIRARTGSIQ